MDVLKTKYQLNVINRIRSLRTAKGISQIKIAHLLDVSSGYIGNVESPRYQHKYTLKQLVELAHCFDVTLDYILTGEHTDLTTKELINHLISYDE